MLALHCVRAFAKERAVLLMLAFTPLPPVTLMPVVLSVLAIVMEPILLTANLETPPTCASIKFCAPAPAVTMVGLIRSIVDEAGPVAVIVGAIATAVYIPVELDTALGERDIPVPPTVKLRLFIVM